MRLPPISLLLLCAVAVVAAAAPCSKPSEADIVWLVDSTALAENELQAVGGLIQAVGEDLHLSPGGVRMGYLDCPSSSRLKVDLANVVDYGKELPNMRDVAAALEAVETEIFAKSKPGTTRVLILFSMDARMEAAARSFKTNQDVLVMLLQVGRPTPQQDFADFVFHAIDFDELATVAFRSTFLCLDEVVLRSNPAFSARSLKMPPAPNRRLVAGLAHFNYIQSNGEVYSWGYYLGLGAGTSSDSAFSIRMLGVSAASDISTGGYHTCVVDGGAAKCCGAGYAGQLGNGADVDSFTVVKVERLSTGVAQVFAGSDHSCAISNNGGMKCWGADIYGQLGSGGGTFSFIPVNVVNYGNGGVHSACAGYFHTCIVTTVGTALCTGAGVYGQLGNGKAANKNIMTKVTGLKNRVTQISCGWVHTCALLSTGTLSCFGDDYYGQLGMGDDGSKIE